MRIFLLLLIGSVFAHPLLDSLQSIDELDSVASYSFTIFSDNKGDSPKSKTEFAKMEAWTKKAAFTIGLGDHVKKGWQNDFLDYYENEEFYPNIADGENEFYGEGQGDFCAGLPLMKHFGITERDNITLGNIPCDYYAEINPTPSTTVHLIQLHYADTPDDPQEAFRQQTKEFLHSTLKALPDRDGQLVIAAAHSRTGEWHTLLPDSTKELLFERADLVLSATTHFFEVLPSTEYGPLIINTGSITHPSSYCPPGYVEVHYLESPAAIVVQYINAAYIERELQNPTYAWLKYIDGEQMALNFRPVREHEDPTRLIGEIEKDISRDSLTVLIEETMTELTATDAAYSTHEAGLTREIEYRDLWAVYPFNNELSILSLAPEEFELIFEERAGTKTVRMVISSYLAEYLSNKYDLERPERTSIREHDIIYKIIEKE